MIFRMPSEVFWMYLVSQGVIILKIIIQTFGGKLDYTEQMIAKDQIVEIKRLENVTE